MSYPEIDDPDFYSKIYSKREFFLPFHSNSSKGISKSQKFLRNFLSPITPYSSILVFHALGTGKTCSAISIGEQYKNISKNFGYSNKILVLVKSDTIATNFINEAMSEFCTSSEYLSKEDRSDLNKLDSKTRESILKKVRKKIKNTYEIVTYGKFVNRTIGSKSKSKDPKKLLLKSIKNLNNRLIIIDEAHNLFGNDYFKAVNTVLNNSKNYKLVLLSATPIFDNLSELPELISLLNPNFSKDTEKLLQKINIFGIDTIVLKDNTESIVKNLIKGRISYLDSNSDSFPDQIDKGTPLSDSPGSVKVINCPMSDYQYSIYKSAFKKDGKVGISVGFKNASDAATIVYPGTIKFGTKGFESIIKDIKKFTEVKKSTSKLSILSQEVKASQSLDEDFDLEFSDLDSDSESELSQSESNTKSNALIKNKGIELEERRKLYIKEQFVSDYSGDNLKQYSTKFWHILNNINLSPNGPVFVFSQFVTKAGVTALSSVLLNNNFKLFTSVTVSQSNPNIPFIAIIDGETTSKQRNTIISIFNSELNKNGKIIKVLLGTPAISEGITLKNIRQIHILEPAWNMSRIYQTIGRGVRNNSHSDLPLEDRNVEIYKYVAVKPKYKNYSGIIPEDDFLIDQRKYFISEQKDRSIKKIFRLFKESAVDCAFNLDRNILPDTLDYSYKCDYTKCNYKCDGFSSGIPELNLKDLDSNTFLLNISNIDYSSIKSSIKSLFLINPFWKLEEIINYFQINSVSIDPLLIYLVLDNLVRYKEILKNPFNLPGFLIYKGSYYIFNPSNVPIKSSIYQKSKIPIVSRKDPLVTFNRKYAKKFNKIIEEPRQSYIPKKLKSISKSQSITKSEKISDVFNINSDFNKNLLDTNPIVGMYYNSIKKVFDGKFRIIDNRKSVSDSSKIDSRKKLRGSVCAVGAFKKDDLVDILNYLKIPLPSSGKKTDLCNLIENYLKENNLILV